MLDEINRKLMYTDFRVYFTGKEYVLEDYGGLDFAPFITLRTESLEELRKYLQKAGILKIGALV